MGWTIEAACFDSQEVLFSKMSSLSLGPTQYPNQWLPTVLARG